LAGRDRRIRVFRQSKNIGAHANFGFTLQQARGQYFMWAATDDWWAPTFVERNIGFLTDHPDYVTSISKVKFDPPLPLPESESDEGTYPLADTLEQNLLDYLMKPGGNSRFYGVHRREALSKAWRAEDYWASDWSLIARLLRYGKQHEVNEVLLVRSGKGASSSPYRAIRNLNLGFVDTWFPMLRFSREMLAYATVRHSPRLWRRLAQLNWRYTGHMLKRRFHVVPAVWSHR